MMKPKELIKILVADGWYIDRIQGSHYILKHTSKPGKVVTPSTIKT